MFKNFIPFATAKNIYEIPMDFYKKLGIKTLLMDLDNTLDSYKLFLPTERAINFFKELASNKIRPIIISNNRGKRVSSYANALGVEYLSSASKPLPFKLKKLVKEKGLDLNETLFVGDQMMTDVLATHYAGIRMILTEKIVKEDQWTTHINRIFGKRIRKYLKKRNKLIDWRTIYGEGN